ncbi:hypothetical protein SAMN06265379_104210 [Saccharicrinis carchari]|uniref:DUF6249 domain-containing protein n=1 Tax=Saccharicrinis carchari TaxID=1168039 RepID=A0A521D4I0_SACCC|nr:DUF6249 domain-containing protein [Saccharicrinis carchari]SMO66613.1 hypothetical protein SAMN06265379_104210 [Saccharicrinis carchari]
MQEVFMVAVVFSGFFYIIKMFTDYLLKRRLIKNGHVEKAEILSSVSSAEVEPQRMKSLKWAMVASMAGLGLIVSFFVGRAYGMDHWNINQSLIGFGIELMFIGLGFLFYFLIASRQK